MDINAVIGKLLKGESLTDAEKDFAEKFDIEKVQNDKAAAARRDAVAKTLEAVSRIKELEAELKEAKEAAASKTQSSDATVRAIQKELAELKKKHEDTENRERALLRKNTIANRAAELGIVAANGVRSELFSQMIEQAVGEVDVTNKDALDGVLNSFKTDNPALILAGGKGGSGIQGGNAGNGHYTGSNPFSRKSFSLDKQIEIDTTNPELAKRLKAEADAEA